LRKGPKPVTIKATDLLQLPSLSAVTVIGLSIRFKIQVHSFPHMHGSGYETTEEFYKLCTKRARAGLVCATTDNCVVTVDFIAFGWSCVCCTFHGRMELRSAEEGVQEMLAEYRRLGGTEKWHLPAIISSDKEDNEQSPPSPPSPQPMDAVSVLSTLESLHERLDAMKAKMDRFRTRLGEVRSCLLCGSCTNYIMYAHVHLITNLFFSGYSRH
jgi:hypothetical protein